MNKKRIENVLQDTRLSAVDAYDVIMSGTSLTTNTRFWNSPQFERNKYGGIDKSWPEDIEKTRETRRDFLKEHADETFRTI